MIKCLLVSTLAYFFISASQSLTLHSCEQLSVEVTTEKDAAVSKSGKIKVRYADEVRSRDFILYLYSPHGDKTKLKGDTTEIKGLSPGKYLLVIIDESSKYCYRQFELEITS